MNYGNCFRSNPFPLAKAGRAGVVAVAACLLSAPVLSNPLNPTVVSGVARFNQLGNVLTVTNSPGAIINWQKFSIQAGETTHFAQASAASSVLNRVLNDPTVIYGTLSSNGRVWLVNPAGIMIGPGGRVDVAAFVATTGSVTNGDFLKNRQRLDVGMGSGHVVNLGRITTPLGGSVYLLGSNVANEGIITTPRGETILAAGATVSLIDSGTPGVKVDITGAAGNATNLGAIAAEAGRIGIAGVIVRNSGTLNASSVVANGGRVFLKALQDAYVDGSGGIVTTGTKGGSVEVLGNRVAVTDNASIDTSGTRGGGRILVGGNYQGMQNANTSYLGPDTHLKADAAIAGAGGTVIIRANDLVRSYGSISARGGAMRGKQGYFEVSAGSGVADIQGNIDVRGSKDKGGTGLLSGGNIQIPVVSGPTNPVVVSGSVSLTNLSGSLTVTNSSGASSNWQQFAIQTGNISLYIQPAASSAVLNQVLASPPFITGTLSATGSVWLANPAGVIVANVPTLQAVSAQ